MSARVRSAATLAMRAFARCLMLAVCSRANAAGSSMAHVWQVYVMSDGGSGIEIYIYFMTSRVGVSYRSVSDVCNTNKPHCY
jgi:hypothetical protein